jgi:hypothetical protein
LGCVILRSYPLSIPLTPKGVDAIMGAGPAIGILFPPFLQWCEGLKITVVTAAGNSEERRLHETFPQRLGTPENGLITVGGVEPDGTVFKSGTRAEPGEAGSMSVYAPARDITVPGGPGLPDFGTSQAAAIVVSVLSRPHE